MSKPAEDWTELSTLVTQLAVGQISDPDLVRLEAMLLDNPRAQRHYCELRALNVELFWKFGKPLATKAAVSSNESTRSPSRRRTRAIVRGATALAVGLAAVVLVALFWSGNNNQPMAPMAPAEPAAFADMSEVVGNVEIFAEGKDAKSAGTGTKLLNGQTVRTGGDESSTAVVYADGTRLDLASATIARLWQTLPTATASKRVFLTTGLMRAEMPESTDSETMIISTPHAEVRLHGAKLASSVDRTSTYVELEEGKAELIRHVDGQSICLTQGSFVVCTDGIEPMTAEPLAAPAEPRSIGKIHGAALRYFPDGAFLAVARGERLEICHPETGASLSTLTGHEKSVRHLVIANSAEWLVSGGFDPYLIVWNLTSRLEERRLPVGPLGTRCLALSGDGRILACVPSHVRQRGAMTLWDLKSGKEIHRIEYPKAEIESLAFSPDGRMLAAVTGDHRIVLWDPFTGQIERTLDMGKLRAQSLAFTRDGRYLIGTCDDHQIRFWDTSRWELAKIHPCGVSGCGSLAVAASGNAIAWGLHDSTVEVWTIDADLQMNQVAVLRKFRKRGPEALAFSPDATRLATTRDWELLKIWDLPKELK